MSENSFSKQGEETQNLIAFCDKDTGSLVVRTREGQQMLYTLVLAIWQTVEAHIASLSPNWWNMGWIEGW